MHERSFAVSACLLFPEQSLGALRCEFCRQAAVRSPTSPRPRTSMIAYCEGRPTTCMAWMAHRSKHDLSACSVLRMRLSSGGRWEHRGTAATDGRSPFRPAPQDKPTRKGAASRFLSFCPMSLIPCKTLGGFFFLIFLSSLPWHGKAAAAGGPGLPGPVAPDLPRQRGVLWATARQL